MILVSGLALAIAAQADRIGKAEVCIVEPVNYARRPDCKPAEDAAPGTEAGADRDASAPGRRIASSPNRGELVGTELPPASADARVPGSGSLTGTDHLIGRCRARQVRVAYRLVTVLDEPFPSVRVAFDGPACSVAAGTSALYLRIEKGDYVGWIRFLMPPSRAGGPEVAISGNPFWGALICGFDGTRTTRCLDAVNARRLLRGGRITGFRFGNR